VNGSLVSSAQVIVTNYSVTGHFTMHLTIIGIRVADFFSPCSSIGRSLKGSKMR